MSTDNVSFGYATSTDAVHIYSLVNTAFRSDKTQQVWLSDERIDVIDIEGVAAKITEHDTVVLTAKVGPSQSDLPVAYCYVSKRGNDSAWLGLLAVDPGYQGRGLGRQLLLHAESYCRQTWGVERLEMDVFNTCEQLMSWYERCGYHKTGTTKPFPYDDAAVLVMREGLYLVDLRKELDGAAASNKTDANQL